VLYRAFQVLITSSSFKLSCPYYTVSTRDELLNYGKFPGISWFLIFFTMTISPTLGCCIDFGLVIRRCSRRPRTYSLIILPLHSRIPRLFSCRFNLSRSAKYCASCLTASWARRIHHSRCCWTSRLLMGRDLSLSLCRLSFTIQNEPSNPRSNS
jgi:hypothetical protein